jgi:hypothetical protein
MGTGGWKKNKLNSDSSSSLSDSSSSLSSALVGSIAPHPAGEPGWSGGLARDLGKVRTTEL